MNKRFLLTASVFLLGPVFTCESMELEQQSQHSKLKQSFSDMDIITEKPILKTRKRSSSLDNVSQTTAPLPEFIYPFPEKITFWEVVFSYGSKTQYPLIDNIRQIGQNWMKTNADHLDSLRTINPPLFLTEVKRKKKTSSRDNIVPVYFIYMLPIYLNGCSYDGTFRIEANITKDLFKEYEKKINSSTKTAQRQLHWIYKEGKGLEEVLEKLNEGKPGFNTPHKILEKNKPFVFKDNPELFRQLCTTNSRSSIIIKHQPCTNKQFGAVADFCEFSSKEKITLSDSNLRLVGIRNLREHRAFSETLTELNMPGQKMGDLSALVLFSDLPFSLKNLDLSGNHIGDVALIGLSSVSNGKHHLEKLSLKNNAIGNLGVCYLFTQNSYVSESLDLSGNNIDELLFVPQKHSFQNKLKVLNVSNTSVGDSSIDKFVFLPSLGCLVFKNSKITDEGKIILIQNKFVSLSKESENWYREVKK